LEDLLIDVSMDVPPTAGNLRSENLQTFLDRAAADRVRTVLKEVGGARVEAAKRLGIERTTLYRLMRKYGIVDDT
jgi:transcriptional regulator of acetoin/glycerol metabolism